MNSNTEDKIKNAVAQIFLEGISDGDTGVTMDSIVREYTNIIKSIAQNEAIALADSIIGKEVEIIYDFKDSEEENSFPEKGSYAVNQFQREQRVQLAKYQEDNHQVVEAIDPLTQLEESPYSENEG